MLRLCSDAAGRADNPTVLRSAHIIMLTAVALIAIGVVMVQSAGMTIGGENPVGLNYRPVVFAGLAILAMLFASRINVRELFQTRARLNPLWLVLAAALIMSALTLVPGLGRNVNGASRWLYLGTPSLGVSFQPSELVKWVMIIAIAWWCARRRGVMHRFWAGLFPAGLLIGFACGLILLEDLGTAVLIGGVAVLLLIAGQARIWQMALLLPPVLGGVVAAIATSPYRVRRLTAFLDPWQDPSGGGYHPIQSMVTIAQGGLTGRGLGNGIQKFGYLPEDTTDFIFAVICEELGIAGAVLVISLYMILLWVGLGIVRDCKDTFTRLVGLGVVLTVGIQAAINIAVVTVVVPTKGIALPLISNGGTGWIMTGFALGLLAALDNAHALHGRPRTEPVTQHVHTRPRKPHRPVSTPPIATQTPLAHPA